MTPSAIRARRVALGLTQGDLARLLGVEDRSVRRWEAGDREPPAELGERLAELAEQCQTMARAWTVAGAVRIPADTGGIPPAVIWTAAGRALEVLGDDVPVEIEEPILPVDGRSVRALSADQVETARAMRSDDATYRQIAAELGVSEGTVRRALGGGGRPGPREAPETIERRVLALHDQGLSHTRIAAQIGRSTMLVRRVLAEHGRATDPHAARKR